MSGSPAARLGDGVKGSKIIQGSRTVLIGSQGGVACSECPGGVAVGQPVSISLGAKVLSGSIDQDFALPGAMPLAWQRQYSSYVNAEHGGACGVFGYGWKSPLELQLLLVNEQAQLFDTAGRLITFEDRLGPGSALYSPSEDIWLLRGGMLDDAAPHLTASHTPATSKPASVVFSSPGLMIGSGPGKQTSIGSAPKDISGSESADDAPSVVHRIEASDAAHWCAREQWQHIPADWASNPNTIIATNGNGQVLWRFEPEAVISASIVNSQRWLLTNKRDRLGREQKLHYASRQSEAQRHVLDTQGQPSDIELPAHLPIAIEDGLGRYYQLQYQCSSASAAIAWQKRLQERITASSKGQEPPAWDVSRGHQGQAGWQMDSGIRLASISVTHSRQSSAPSLAAVPLVRYTYSAAGDLTGVYDRSGTLVREFKYANHLMVAHRHRQGPWHRYVYETEDAQYTTALPGARVKVHTNQEGLDWQFDYQTDPLDPKRSTTLVQDSLGRQERYDFQGLGGLKRLVSHTRADGSITKTGYNGFGHPTSTTNALGHSSYMSRDGQGRIITTQSPEGLHTQASYNALGLLSTTEDANGIRTRYDYDRYGRLHRITTQARGSRADEEPLEHRYHYPDPNEQPLIAHLPSTITDARGGTKQLSYNQAGQQTRYTDCSGQSTYWGWDEWGQLTITSDAQGNSQHYTYDAAGQLLSTELANGQRMHNQWSESGQLVRSWLEDSQGLQVADTEVQLHYDLWGRLIEREQSGSSLKLRYDKAARLVELINENGASSRFGWDVMDRQSEEQGFDGRLQRYQYDAAGQLSAHQDGHQHSEPKHWLYNQYRFGKDGQLLQILSNQHSDDPSNPGTVQRMQELHYTTGLFNRICSYVQQPGDQEQWLESETLIERDQLGRMIGEVQRLWAQPGSPQAKPDNPLLLNPITKRPPPEHEYHIRHQLDALGNRIRTEQSQLPATHYLLYGAGHVHGIHINGQEVLAIERDSLHRETQRRYGNGISQTQSYTALGQLRSQDWQLQQHASDPLIGQFKERHYHYDALGQITAITHGQEGPHGQSTPSANQYRYDNQGRLTAAQQTNQTPQHWRFDAAGNRLPVLDPHTNAQESWVEQVKAQWRNPRFNPLGEGQISPNERVQQWIDNRVHYSEAALYHYDGRGNRTRSAQLADGSVQELRYDSYNQLLAIGSYNAEGELTHVSRYRYDSLGRRVAQTVQTYTDGKATGQEATYYG
ncbi:DUF6531 domain-containing protein [Lampropedia aestuarii]|uniref:DUF6531 domain-containing protein n=1 Tax=Lampropedia aestuarii TaxID=2562762 RepID=UPI002468E911|nr:DUF6531 domain-containing protein [Lampropedia aestuarii]MDH5856536.1 DUF6531 domain-containing protein [Lampropedia aestuarii]